MPPAKIFSVKMNFLVILTVVLMTILALSEASEVKIRDNTLNSTKLPPPQFDDYYFARLPRDVVIKTFCEFEPPYEAVGFMFSCKRFFALGQLKSFFKSTWLGNMIFLYLLVLIITRIY